jgi:hypothetical protein
MAKEITLILTLALGIPLALVGFLWLLFATFGKMALLGALITLDLGLLIGFAMLIIRDIRSNR